MESRYVGFAYSIENYQLDPLIVFGVLMEERKAPTLPNINLSAGDEHLLRTLNATDLQRIVDYVAAEIAPLLGALTPDEQKLSSVSFTNGVVLTYPGWMLRRRGHDLLQIFQKKFGNFISSPRLEKSFRRVRLVPVELAEMMSRFQAPP